MTKKEALDWLVSRKEHYELDDNCQELAEAIGIGIDAIEQELCDKCVYSTSEGCQYDDITETIPPFDDCISRKAVLDTLERMDKALDEDRTVENYKELLRECYKVLPSAKSEWQQDHEILKAYSNGANEVLDKIRAEIDVARFLDKDKKLFKNANASGLEVAMDIIDKYMAESEVSDANSD